MQSGATPRNHEARVAASGLMTIALATLVYAAVGFGFMFGGVGTVLNLPDLSHYVTYYMLPVNAQNWGIIGLRGFFLNGVNETSALQLFVTFLPLAITCAMLPASFTLAKAGIVTQAALTLLLAGLLFPLVGFWIWGRGPGWAHHGCTISGRCWRCSSRFSASGIRRCGCPLTRHL
jgi:Amt family ammonium transporter